MDKDKRNRRIEWPRLTCVDLIALLLLVYLATLGLISKTLESKVSLFTLLIMGALYILLRLLLAINRFFTSTLILIAIAISCLYETVGGFRDILMRTDPISSHQYGSFFNSGPLAGYLAVCSCLLVAYANTIRSKWLKNIIWIVTIPALILIPATFSRASIIALLFSISVLFLKTDIGQVFIKENFKWLIPVLIFSLSGLYLLKKPSADGRLFMGKICIHSIMTQGITGAGLGRYSGAYGEAQYDYFNNKVSTELDELDLSLLDSAGRLMADCPENAFNEFLKMGVEAGPLAAILFLGLLLSSIAASWKSEQIWQYGLMSFMIFACFSYPLHHWSFRILLVILLAASSSSKSGRGHLSSVIVLSTFLSAIAILLIKIFPQVSLIKEAEQSYKEIHLLYSFNKYNGVTSEHEKLFPYLRSDDKFLFDYGKSLNKNGKYENSNSILLLGTRVSCDPMFWNLMGNNHMALGDYQEAERCYKHAFIMLPNRLYPLYLLTKLYYSIGDNERASNMAKFIMEFKPKVESVTTDNFRKEIYDLILSKTDGL